MRIILPVLSSLTLFAACKTTYQYNTISSSNLRLNDKKEFVAENDTMRMVYNFNGNYAPVYLYFENKLDMPIFIDWQRSALIVDKSIFSYMPARATLQGEIRDTTVTSTPAVRTITGSIMLPETVEFLPPHSQTTKNPLKLPAHTIGKLPDSILHGEIIPGAPKTQKVQVANFTGDNSPIRFRSYITFRVGEPTAQPVAYDHHFYVSESMSTNLNTLYFQDRMQDGNRYYVTSSSATVGGTLIGCMLIGGLLAVAAANGQKAEPE